MNANWWLSPGPARLVRRVATDLRTGRSIILLAPSFWPSGFRGQVTKLVREIFTPTDTIVVSGAHSGDPAVVLNDELHVLEGSTRPTPARLANARGGHFTWVRLEDDHAAIEPWIRFLAAFAHASSAASAFERWLIVLEVSGVDRLPAGIGEASLAIHEVRRYSDLLDTALFVAQGIEDEHPLARAFRIQMITGLGLWDSELCEALSARELIELAAPYAFLREFGLGRGWTAETAGWFTGADDEHEGLALSHSSILALRGDRLEIDYRLWRAQVGTVLPLVEEHRRILGERYIHLLQFPIATDDGRINDVRDLQIGLLAFHLLKTKGVDRAHREMLVLLRGVRNRLAHYEPLIPTQLTSLVHLPRLIR
jgi:hypothetical protein